MIYVFLGFLVNKSVDPATEVRLIVQALRINTLSKLAFNDSKLFDGLVLDVFPGVKFEDIAYAELREALVKACETMNLEVIDSQVCDARVLWLCSRVCNLENVTWSWLPLSTRLASRRHDWP